MSRFSRPLVAIIVLIISGCGRHDAKSTNEGAKSAPNAAVANIDPAGGPIDGLYFKVYQSGGSAVREYFLFTRDGHVSTLPFGGIDPFDFAANAKSHSGTTGTYTLKGDELVIHFANDKTTKMSFKTTKEGVEFDGYFAEKVGRFPAGTKLAGTYTGGSSSIGGGDRAVAFRTIEFRPDGSYEMEATGAVVATGPTVKGSTGSTGGEKGRYTIDGNTLRLTRSDGRVSTATVFPYEGYGGQEMLGLDGMLLTKKKG